MWCGCLKASALLFHSLPTWLWGFSLHSVFSESLWSNQIPHRCWTEPLAEKVFLTFTRKSLQLTRFNLLSLCCSVALLRPSFFSICSLPIPACLSLLPFSFLCSVVIHTVIAWAVASSLPTCSLPLCFSVAGDLRREKHLTHEKKSMFLSALIHAVPPLLPRWRQNARYYWKGNQGWLPTQIQSVFKLCVRACLGLYACFLLRLCQRGPW